MSFLVTAAATAASAAAVTAGATAGGLAAGLAGVAAGGLTAGAMGAGVGAISAAAQGQDVGKGALMGAASGVVTAGVAGGLGAAGAGTLVSGTVGGAAGGAAGAAAGGEDVGKGAMIGGATGAVTSGVGKLAGAVGPAPVAGAPATAGTPIAPQAPAPIPGGAGNTTGAAVISPTPESGGVLSDLADSAASGLSKTGTPITGNQVSGGLKALTAGALTDYAGHSIVNADEAADKAAGEDALRAGTFANQNQAGMNRVQGLGFGSPSGPMSSLGSIGRATGGLTALAHGGQVPLKDGAYIIPADVVSALGNGSSKAGAEFLRHLMMEVRKESVNIQGLGAAKKHVA